MRRAAAQTAFDDWRRTPAPARIQYLFKLKNLLEAHFDDLARTITQENGKIVEEAAGELRRAIENVEVACGIPTMMLGDFSEDVARGVDEYMIRQPVGVAAIIAPFNFPGMIPFWYLPYALACGNTVIVKPSERCPITMQKVFRLLEEAGFPPGVVNLVNGGAETVNALLDHPAIAAVTFVGSTATARHVYARASASGKRVQAQGGAKNPLIILPDADRAADHQHRDRQRVRQRGPALPGRLARHHRRRGGSHLHAGAGRGGDVARGRLRVGCRGADGAGHHAAEPGAHHRA